MGLETIFDDVRLLGVVGLSFQVPVLEGIEDLGSNILTVATISDLRARSVANLVIGSTIAFVDANGRQYRLIPNTGNPDNGTTILASTNPSAQWFTT